MKYFLSLLFILFFCLPSFAKDCPSDKPLLGNNGICYSCDENDNLVILNKVFGKGSCSDICPNRSWKCVDLLCFSEKEICRKNGSLEDYYKHQEFLKEQLKTPYGKFRYQYLNRISFYLNFFVFFFLLRGIIPFTLLKRKVKENRFISILKSLICGISAFAFSIITIAFNCPPCGVILCLSYLLFRYIKKRGIENVLLYTRIILSIVFAILIIINLPSICRMLAICLGAIFGGNK